MPEPKTKRTDNSVRDFLASIADQRIRDDCQVVARMMERATKKKPKLWGNNIVGFGTYTMRYANGKEAQWMLTAFAPRKQKITLYLMSGFKGFDSLVAKLGKHAKGKSCLHLNRLSDVHAPTLEKLIVGSVKAMKQKYETTD